MLDFLMISQKPTKRGTTEIYPKFIIRTSSDLMIRGGDFYAIWDEENHMWSTDEEVAIRLIDKELDKYAAEHTEGMMGSVSVLHMWDADSGTIDRWHKYVQKQMRDHYKPLDEKLIFANQEIKKTDYASRKLNYALEEGDISAYDELVGTLYSPEERKKIEWAIGSVVAGESKNLQKFLVMYGSAGTGKSTVLNIIFDLFTGYCSVFDAKSLGQANNAFALEAFKSNPLVAIQHDGDLSRIEDNTRLNSVVSHEMMTVNEKFKAQYQSRFNAFLFMGTNKPVKITDAKSGILRRLIDVTPSGKKVSQKRYKELTNQIKFELGAIAWHCRQVYLDDPNAYDAYIPTSMMDSTNDFYNFVMDSDAFEVFHKQDKTTLKQAYELYSAYCDEARVSYPLNRRAFKAELMNYFTEFCDRGKGEDANLRSVYYGFISDKFTYKPGTRKTEAERPWLTFAPIASVFDAVCAEELAQYASEKETPTTKWSETVTTLQELDTSRLHYVKVPENHIVIDFDIPDEEGHKSFEKNQEAASKWPPTYAELSKSGAGIHLHYIYNGDPSELSRVYADHIEVKVFTGKSSLRRKLTKCNNLPIASISSGLPLREEKKMISFDGVKTEKSIRASIKKALNKEVHANTKSNIDFIDHVLKEAYEQGISYDLTDMRPAVMAFAANSTHQSDYCIKLVNKMKFKSEEPSQNVDNNDKPIIFYDVEVFPNLFLINWKREGEGHNVVRMINPTPGDVEDLLKNRLVGFNCRRYDNHILYARLMGYTNEELFRLSSRIVAGSDNCFFSEAYNLSYTDIYDFCSKKQSLKKWEIELGIHHQELGLPWDQPVPENLWEKVAEYCDNDVIATEAVWNARKGDFIAREILADVAGGTVNDTTNSLTTKIIFGNNRKPQSAFNYRNLAEPCNDKPFFEGYVFDHGKSTYRGFEVGEGGFVWACPGMYERAITFDVASMHPSSVIAENLFGDEYTQRFKDILEARIAIKHKDFDKAKTMLNGALARHLENEDDAKALAQALKIAINSVYGLTAAKFENPFRDPRNIDNIVAKRGALFMITLKEAVEAAGGKVIHIKTDSIKVVNPGPQIQRMILDMGKQYGYNFEIEHIFEKICLVNDAVYVAKLATDDPDWSEEAEKARKEGKPEPTRWTATGAQFQVPYVFKTLFSKEPIVFSDLCETKAVSTSLYLDMNENKLDKIEELEGLKKDLARFERQKLGAGIETTSNKIKELESDQLHNYIFVGKVGEFCPIKKGCGGGELVREAKDKDGNTKYASATGCKDYRWLESETVKNLEKTNDIDKSYYQKLVDGAIESLNQYGDTGWFLE